MKQLVIYLTWIFRGQGRHWLTAGTITHAIPWRMLAGDRHTQRPNVPRPDDRVRDSSGWRPKRLERMARPTAVGNAKSGT